MKKELIIFSIFLLLLAPIISAEQVINPKDLLNQQPTTNNQQREDIASLPTNPWNETIIISPTWQKIIGPFFGLNLKKESTEISVRETLTLLAIFIMFLVIILDILKLTPFFKIKILDTISGEFIAALIITTLVSISGSLINLKNLFLQAVAYTITKLDWNWINTANKYTTLSSILSGAYTIIIFIIIWQVFDVITPWFKRYSQVSRAEAKGRRLNAAIENQQDNT